MKAVVLIDVQNDFVNGALGSEWAQQVAPKIVDFVKSVKDNPEYEIFATRDTHGKDYLNTMEGKRLPVPHCIQGTPGWELIDDLKDLVPFDNVVDKCTFMSCKYFSDDNSDLADIINEAAIERYTKNKGEVIDEIIICGFVTSICVVSNALHLRARRTETPITVYSDLCACVSEASHNAALEVMKNCQIDIKTLG